MARQTPVGKAQQQVLDALGLKADCWQEAKRVFAEIGIEVGSRREGRSSVPVVSIHRNFQGGGGWNPGGDGEYVPARNPKVDLTPVKQWMED